MVITQSCRRIILTDLKKRCTLSQNDDEMPLGTAEFCELEASWIAMVLVEA